MSMTDKYFTNKLHFYYYTSLAFLLVAYGVAHWIPELGKSQVEFWSGLVFVLLGATIAVSDIFSCCWYPEVLENHIILKHFLFHRMSRIIRYEDILYARVIEFKARLFDGYPVLTVMMKDGKKMSFTLMTKLEQMGQLSQELLEKGVPDAYEIPASVTGRKTYCSRRALAIFVVFIAAMVAGYVAVVMALASPLIIVVTVVFVPFLIFLLNSLSYIVIEDGRIMLKYMVLRSRNIDMYLDDVYDVSIGGSSHLDILLKAPDQKGKSRYTRSVGLVSIDMIQDINALLKNNSQR